MPALKPYRAAPDTWVLPSYLRVPGLGLIVLNSYLIIGREPVVIDTGMPVVREEFLESLWSLVDPKDVKWLFLTHDDIDHSGNLIEVLSAATNAKLVTQFIGYARLETAYHMRPERVHLMNPGQILDAGDRKIVILRPPLFDSPSTSALFDDKSRVLFSADAFGAFIPHLAEDVSDVPEAEYNQGFEIFNRGNHPWSAWADPAKIEVVLEQIRRLGPQVIAGCHSPMARGRTEAHLTALHRLIGMEPLLGPEQKAFEGIMAAMTAANAKVPLAR
jgi:flavorubredoxin